MANLSSRVESIKKCEGRRTTREAYSKEDELGHRRIANSAGNEGENRSTNKECESTVD